MKFGNSVTLYACQYWYECELSSCNSRGKALHAASSVEEGQPLEYGRAPRYEARHCHGRRVCVFYHRHSVDASIAPCLVDQQEGHGNTDRTHGDVQSLGSVPVRLVVCIEFPLILPYRSISAEQSTQTA